jgi:alanine dehydrogenase
LTQATLPLLQILAREPLAALRDHSGLRNGLQLYRGQVTHPGLAEDLGLSYFDPATVLA